MRDWIPRSSRRSVAHRDSRSPVWHIDKTPALVLTVLICSVCRAQVASDGQPESVDPSVYCKESIVRVAYMDLRARPQPTPDAYLMTETLLGLAQQYDPDDTQLLRSRIRAAWAAGDGPQVEALTRSLIRLDPSDTVAQLRLISAHIDHLQTVEDRIAAYERLLGPGGASLDPSILSRLALDGALLAREQNDLDRFEKWLKRSMELDSTNKEAAALAWSYFGPLLVSRADRLELLLNLLYADPTDPNVYEMITAELALGGAFEQAGRFQSLGMSLFNRFSSKPNEKLVVESIMISWQKDGPQKAVDAINKQLTTIREEAAQKIAFYKQQRLPTESLPKPEEMMLAPVYNKIRLVAAIAAKDQPTIDATIVDMVSVFQQTIDEAAQADKLSGETERAQRAIDLWSAMAGQLVAMGWADTKPETLKIWSERAEQVFGPDNELTRTLKAWSDLRNGEPQLAASEFEALGDSSRMYLVGRAIAYEKIGRVDDAASILNRIAREAPMSLEGVWAREKHIELTNIDPMDTPVRARLEAIAGSVPKWIDRMTQDPRNFMTLQVKLDKTSVRGIEPCTLHIRLRNIAPIPLGVGGDRPINSRFMFAPRVLTGSTPRISYANPEIEELDQRFRLMPTEAIEADLSLDLGAVGYLVEAFLSETVRERWQVLQGYSLDANGVPSPGALCLQTQSEMLLRSPLPQTHLEPAELISLFQSVSVTDLPEVLAAVRVRLLERGANGRGLTSSERSELAAVAAQRYEHLSPQFRALMLAVLPTTALVPEMTVFDQTARNESDPSLVPLMLVTRVSKADDPLIAQWLDNSQTTEQLHAFVRAFSMRLASPDLTYARLTAEQIGLIDDDSSEPATP